MYIKFYANLGWQSTLDTKSNVTDSHNSWHVEISQVNKTGDLDSFILVYRIYKNM